MPKPTINLRFIKTVRKLKRRETGNIRVSLIHFYYMHIPKQFKKVVYII